LIDEPFDPEVKETKETGRACENILDVK